MSFIVLCIFTQFHLAYCDVITTIAGSSSSGGYSGDGSAATSAKLYYPQGVALDSSGFLFVAFL